jgi:hypothetical protein
VSQVSSSDGMTGWLWASEPNAPHVPLPRWLFVTEDDDVAEAVARLYEGERRISGRSVRGRELLLGADRIPILLNSRDEVGNQLTLKGGAGTPSGNCPKLNVKLCFQLAEAPEVGTVCFVPTSQQCREAMRAAVREIANVKHGQWELRLQRKVLRTRSGIAVSYSRPLLAMTSERATSDGSFEGMS